LLLSVTTEALQVTGSPVTTQMLSEQPNHTLFKTKRAQAIIIRNKQLQIILATTTINYYCYDAAHHL